LKKPAVYVCIYVCNNIYVRAAAYNLDCHGGAIVNHKLYKNISVFNRAQN